MKHYKLVEFLSIFGASSPLHKSKAPYGKLSGDGSEMCVYTKSKSAWIMRNYAWLVHCNKHLLVWLLRLRNTLLATC